MTRTKFMHALHDVAATSLRIVLAAVLVTVAGTTRAAPPAPSCDPAGRLPLRRVTHDLIALADTATITPPFARRPDLECLGEPVHAPWVNPYSNLPSPLAERDVRMTLGGQKATVELREALLVEAPKRGRTLAYDIVPMDRARLELGYRLYGCSEGKGDVLLEVAVVDLTGRWTTTRRLTFERPPRDAASPFREVEVDLPMAPGEGARLELTLTPVREDGDGVMVALAEPVVSGIATGPRSAADTNVLWIVIDSVRSDALGPQRAFAPSPTPELDRRIFERGTGFAWAYSLGNQTRTSTLSMLASLPSSIGGFHSNSWGFTSGRRETFYAKKPPLVTLELLRQGGHRVAHFGNNFFLWNSVPVGLDMGFPRIMDFRSVPADTVRASDEAVALIERRKDERWFLMLNYNAPHTPYRAPPDHDERAKATDFTALPGRTLPSRRPHKDRVKAKGKPKDDDTNDDHPHVGFLPKSYLGELMWVDDNVMRVFAKLEELGLLDDTLVMVTADHGEVMNPAHDCAPGHVQLRCGFNHSVTVYDDELHVPLGMALPGRIAAGRTLDLPVSHADLAPTILDLLGLEIPARFVGRSRAAELARGAATPQTEDDLVIGQPGAAVPASFIYADGRLASALRIGRWKLIVHAPADDAKTQTRLLDANGAPMRHELYDLAADPLELVNLAPSNKPVLDTMLAALSRLRTDLRARFEGTSDPASSSPATASSRAIATASTVTDAAVNLMVTAGAEDLRLSGTLASPRGLRCPDAPPPSPLVRCRPLDPTRVEVDLAVPARGTFAVSLHAVDQDAPLAVDVTLNGQPFPTERLRLGPWGVAVLAPGQRLDSAQHLAMARSPRAPLPQPGEAGVYLWQSSGATSTLAPVEARPPTGGPASPEDESFDPDADQQLGDNMKKVLKDLGYTH
jgi:hypothetical protein